MSGYEKNINYVNTDHFFHTNFNQLNAVFLGIIQELVDTMFAPVAGTNDLGVEDSITYMDPVGKYMDVKDVKNLTLFGELYDITVAAVYSYKWNVLYLRNSFGSSSGRKFVDGWYKGDPVEETSGIIDGNADVVYGGAESLPNGYFGDDPWADGWMFRVGDDIVRKFVPNTSNPNNSRDIEKEILNKLKNTEYTFYRIDLPQSEREKLHINPAYLKPGKTEDDMLVGKAYSENGDHLSDPGIYALSDLRIWVEDSGDYNDPNVEDGGAQSDANFDEALWIDIPANMLPLYKISIDANADGTLTYSTNLVETNPGYKSSFPLRVFYTVGVSSELLTSDGSIDLAAKVSPEYIKENRVSSDTAATARGVEYGNVEFFSNWYNAENRYSDYATTNIDYSYGDPITSFSVNSDNRYYIFEKALPLYSNAYQFNGSSWNEVLVSSSDFGGRLIAQDIGDGNTQPGDISLLLVGKRAEPGDIVLLKRDRLSDVTQLCNSGLDPFSSEMYYFLAIEYFELNVPGGSNKANRVQYVIARKGSEFGTAYHTAGITNGDMLCWHDVSGNHMQNYPYLSYSETNNNSCGKEFIGVQLGKDGWYTDCTATGYPDMSDPTNSSKHNEMISTGEWVVCAKPGGLRVGDLAQKIRGKGGNYTEYEDYAQERFPGKEIQVGYYDNNITRTANNYYVPTISSASIALSEDIIVNVYLGNNGRLWTMDTTLLLTKIVESTIPGTSASPNREFNFQVYLSDVTGPLTAIRVRYNETAGEWQRQIHYIDMELSNKLLLQTTDSQKVVVDNDGCRLTIIKNEDGTDEYKYTVDCTSSSGFEHHAGDSYNGIAYYVYIGSPDQETIGGTDTTLRIYHNQFCGTTDETVGSLIKVKYSITDSNGNKTEYESDGSDIPADFNGTREFYASSVDLVPVSEVDSDPNGWTHGYGYTTIKDFYLATLDPSTATDSSAVSIISPYRTQSQYLTETVYFGYKYGASGDSSNITGIALEAADLYVPTSTPGYYGTDPEPWTHTAEVRLKDGWGLLFSSLDYETNYGFAEKIREDDIVQGYAFDRAEQIQQDGMTTPGENDAIELPEHTYFVNGNTGANEEASYFFNIYTEGRQLPETGGPGLTLIYCISAAFLLAGIFITVIKRKSY